MISHGETSDLSICLSIYRIIYILYIYIHVYKQICIYIYAYVVYIRCQASLHVAGMLDHRPADARRVNPKERASCYTLLMIRILRSLYYATGLGQGFETSGFSAAARIARGFELDGSATLTGDTVRNVETRRINPV